MSIGTRIFEARKLKNITQDNLAAALNVTRQSVSRWENDIAYPEIDKLVELSRILEVSCDYILKNEEQDKTTKKDFHLLHSLIGSDVQIELFSDEDIDLLYPTNKCIIKEIENGWL